MANQTLIGNDRNDNQVIKSQFDAINLAIDRLNTKLDKIQSDTDLKIGRITDTINTRLSKIEADIESMKPNRDKIIDISAEISALESDIDDLNREPIIDVQDFDYIG